jgi:hypothetical protein
MHKPKRTVGLALAATVGIAIGLLLPVPGSFAPTIAVLSFVLASFLLRCASAWATLVFALVVAASPALAFAAGLSTHTPVLASLGQAFEGFASHLSLVLLFVALPLAAGGLLYCALNRAFSSHARQSH